MAVLLATGPAAAQAPLSAAPAPVEIEPGVTAYPPAYFADSEPSHALDMVKRLPGFTYDPGNTETRGFSGAGGNVLIDGQRPSAKSVSLDDILTRIQPGAVARIDLVRTTTTGIEMQGRPVVANVIRKTGAAVSGAMQAGAKITGDEPGGEVRVEWARRDGPLSIEAAAWAEREEDGWDGAGRRMKRDAAGRLVEDGAYLADYGEIDLAGNASVEYRREADALRVNLGAGYERVDDLDRADIVFSSRGPFRHDTDSRTVEKTGEIGLDYERTLSDRLTGRAIALQRLTHTLDESASIGSTKEVADETSDAGETIFRATATYRGANGMTVDGGIEGAFNFLDAQTGLTRNGAPVALPNANVRIEERRGEAFAIANLTVTEKLSVQLTARHEMSQISQSGDSAQKKTFSFFKPQALATYSHGPYQARLRLERQVGQLNFRDFAASSELESGTVTAGNADLEPERWWTAELALERRFWEKGAVVLSFRREWVQEALDRVPIFTTTGGVFEAPGNVGDATRDFAKLNLTLPLDALGVGGGLFKLDGTWRWSSIDDPVTRLDRSVTLQRPFFANVSLSKDMPSLNSVVMLTGHMGYREVAYRLKEVRVQEEDPWLTLYWDWKARPDLTIRAEVENVLGRERRRERTFYDGTRASGVIVESEALNVDRDRTFMLRIRKTL